MGLEASPCSTGRAETVRSRERDWESPTASRILHRVDAELCEGSVVMARAHAAEVIRIDGKAQAEARAGRVFDTGLCALREDRIRAAEVSVRQVDGRARHRE